MTRQARYQARLRQTRRKAGVCVYCGAESGGKRRCDACRESKNRARRKHHADMAEYYDGEVKRLEAELSLLD